MQAPSLSFRNEANTFSDPPRGCARHPLGVSGLPSTLDNEGAVELRGLIFSLKTSSTEIISIYLHQATDSGALNTTHKCETLFL
jgi:hypothetical protein